MRKNHFASSNADPRYEVPSLRKNRTLHEQITQANVYSHLTLEWQSIAALSKMSGLNTKIVSLACLQLHSRGEIAWKPMPINQYKLKSGVLD